jgi:hypothetical protein
MKGCCILSKDFSASIEIIIFVLVSIYVHYYIYWLVYIQYFDSSQDDYSVSPFSFTLFLILLFFNYVLVINGLYFQRYPISPLLNFYCIFDLAYMKNMIII